jgi:predicted RNA-binding protein with PIN domain
MDYLIVDGYNIIHAWRTVFDMENDSLENNRVKLIEMLSNYQGHTEYEIVIVFDAYKVVDGIGSLLKYDNIRIVYTKENQTADNFIERFVMDMRGMGNIIVATGDQLEQKTVLIKGGLRLTARELKYDILMANKKQKKDKYTKGENSKFEDFLSKEQVEIFEKMRRGNE